MKPTPAWLQTWVRWYSDGHPEEVRVSQDEPYGLTVIAPDMAELDEDTCGLVAAAPDLVRVLLAIEWEGARHDLIERVCPKCGKYQGWTTRKHDDRCGLDAALTKAGFPTAQSRTVARKALDALESLRRAGG